MNRIGLSLVLLAFAAPVLLLSSTLVLGQSEHFNYFIKQGLILEYLTNSALVTILTATISFLIAVPAAWWVSFYEFKGRRVLEWALVLPLAVPPYLAEDYWTNTGFPDFSGDLDGSKKAKSS